MAGDHGEGARQAPLLKLPRRALIGGASLAGLTGLGAMIYRAAPAFWQQFAREARRPIAPPLSTPDPGNWPDTGLHTAWLGHSTVLIKVNGYTIITDPVFSDRAGLDLGMVTLGVKRLVAPAVPLAGLPRIDLILLSHAHMDHFDIPSLRALESRATSVVTAVSTSDLLRVDRYKAVRELRWGQSTRVGPVEIRAFEVSHWGARMRTDTYRGYNGYTLETGRHRILFAGDTAYTDKLRALKRSRPYELAIMPIGAYNPWIAVHCNPEQAWRMGNEVGAEFFLPVHHRTFTLSREPIHEPLERLLMAASPHTGRIAVSHIGDEFQIS